MKKNKTALLLVFAFILTLLCGCGSSSTTENGIAVESLSSGDKRFTIDGLSIVLPSDFTADTLKSYTAIFESENITVTALKEDFSVLEEGGVSPDISLSEYAKIVLKNKNIEANVEETDGLTTYKYEKPVITINHTYFSTVFKSDSAFWIIKFACKSDIFEKNEKDFIKWAKTVEF